MERQTPAPHQIPPRAARAAHGPRALTIAALAAALAVVIAVAAGRPPLSEPSAATTPMTEPAALDPAPSAAAGRAPPLRAVRFGRTAPEETRAAAVPTAPLETALSEAAEAETSGANARHARLALLWAAVLILVASVVGLVVRRWPRRRPAAQTEAAALTAGSWSGEDGAGRAAPTEPALASSPPRPPESPPPGAAVRRAPASAILLDRAARRRLAFERGVAAQQGRRRDRVAAAPPAGAGSAAPAPTAALARRIRTFGRRESAARRAREAAGDARLSAAMRPAAE